VRRVALPSRLQGSAIDQLPDGVWRIWLHTNDHVHGSYLLLYPSGKVERITVRDVNDVENVMVIMPEGTHDGLFFPTKEKPQ
jgi:hypothetical protein